MQLICHPEILLLGVILSSVRAQLLFNDTETGRDDGPCTYPSPVPLKKGNFLVNPFQMYYVPFASENFYRFEYQMAKNEPAQTEDDVTSLQTKVYVSAIDILQNLAPLAVSFFGSRDVHYSYKLSPSWNSNNPFFDLTATTVHGSNGTAPTGFGGEIKFTIIWNDSSPAWNIYTCIGGRQMFHIVSGAPTLTDDQMETNKELLKKLGFNPDNFQFLKYSE